MIRTVDKDGIRYGVGDAGWPRQQQHRYGIEAKRWEKKRDVHRDDEGGGS